MLGDPGCVIERSHEDRRANAVSIPDRTRGRHACPGDRVRIQIVAARRTRRYGAATSRQCGHTARDCAGVVRDARRALGIRISDRRCGGHRRRRRWGDLTGWCRLRHLLWGAVVGEQRGPRAAATKAPSADGSLGRCDTARCGRQRRVATAQPPCTGECVDRWCPLRGGTRTWRSTGPRGDAKTVAC